MERVVVYTALFGNKDKLWSVPPVASRGAKYVAFVDSPRPEAGLWTEYNGRTILVHGTEDTYTVRPTWEQRVVKPKYGNRRTARYCKALSHTMFPDASITIWLDANIRLRAPVSIALKWLGAFEFAAFRQVESRYRNPCRRS